MYERGCPQRLNDRMAIWMGLEWEEIVAGMVAGAVVGLVALPLIGVAGILAGVLAGAGILSLLRVLHSGPPGFLFTRLYRWGLWTLVPAPFRPRYLIPIPPGLGRARIRLSPVSGENDDGGKRLARFYFHR